MTSRHLKAIFGVLALLVAAYAALQWLSGGSRAPGDESIPAAVRDGLPLVRVSEPGDADSLRIEESEGTWTVNGYPADTGMVRRLREGLDSARVGRLVARSASNHDRLGVSEDLGTRVQIGPAGEPDVSFLLGRGGADGRFVRFPPSDEVFTVPTFSVRLLGRSLDDWRSRIVAEVDTARVSRIVIRREDEPAPSVLTRAADVGTGWSLDGEVADSTAVAALLAESSRLQAAGFPSDSVAFAVDFNRPIAVLELFDSDQPGAVPAVSLLFVTAPDAPQFLVRRADDPLSYRLALPQAERLLPSRPTLRKAP